MTDQKESRPLPPLPFLNLPEVFALRNELADEAAFGHEHTLLRGRAYDAFVNDLAACLKKRGVAPEVLYDSCRDVLGQELTDDRLFDLSWRLAGNLAALRRGIPSHPWTAQREPEWMPLSIVQVEPGRNRYDVAGAWLSLRVLAGTACPRVIKQFWSQPQCGLFARTVLGFTWGTRAKAPMPYSHPLQLARLRLYGFFEPALSRGKPAFRHVKSPATMRAYNVSLLRVRYRHDPCPRGWSHPCIACALGYLSPKGKTCKAATHPTQWYADYCPACGKDDQPFDDTLKSTVCVHCATKRRLAPKGGT